MTQTETLAGITIRPVTFSITDADTVVRNIRSYPAGTEVYVTRIHSNGLARIRACGSLYEQTVRLATTVTAI